MCKFTQKIPKNDNKYIPANLDGYGIKSKYLIGELNDETSHTQIKSLNYICKLFGGNYIDYIKQIPWKNHCYVLIGNKKTGKDREKKSREGHKHSVKFYATLLCI